MNSDMISRPNIADNEQGVALVLTVFVVSLATILVVEFANTAHFDQRISRQYSESVQGDYILKSGRTLAQVLLEIPKLDAAGNADWLGEPWHAIASAPSLPIEGFVGTPRISIYDESGKIDLNSIASGGLGSQNPAGYTGAQGVNAGNVSGSPSNDPGLIWKNRLVDLFLANGFFRESYDEKDYRTRGNIGFDAETQVAVIHDWIDRDTDAYSSAGFGGSGIESSSNKEWFFNRKLNNLSEALLIPGMTKERLARIAPFVRIGRGGNAKININTAPADVLSALGITDAEVTDIVQERLNLPIDQDTLNRIKQLNPQLQNVLVIKSHDFSVIARVEMPASTRWLKAYLSVSGQGLGRRSNVLHTELY